MKKLLFLSLFSCLSISGTAIARPDGEPSREPFTLGWFAYQLHIPDLPKKIAAEGYNTLVLYDAQKCDETPAACPGSAPGNLDRILENARENNVKVYLEVSRPAIQKGELETIVNFVRKYKNHPAIGGWYLFDEPELAKIDGRYIYRENPRLLAAAYRAIKREDPEHFVLGAHYGRSPRAGISLEPFVGLADRITVDYYVVFKPPECPSNNEFGCDYFFRDMPEDFNRIQQFYESKGQPPFLPAIQGSGEAEFGKREPTRAEARYYTFVSILNPTSGIYYWMWEYSNPAFRNGVLKPSLDEIRPYLPYLFNKAERSLTADRAKFTYRAYRKNDNYFAVIVNPNETGESVTFSVDKTVYPNNTTPTVLCDGKPVKITGRKFTLTLAKFDARICTY